MDDFILRALVAGLGVAVVAGPLGTVLVWRRMAFFGDAVAHAALLGVAAGVAVGIDVQVGVVAVCLGVAALLVGLGGRREIADDTLLAIFAQGGLALGVTALAVLPVGRVDIVSFLFGDILAVDGADLLRIYATAAAVLVVLVVLWRSLVAIAIDEDLARVGGVAVGAVRLAFMLAVAAVVAASMQVVGVLLTTALMIAPAAASRHLARTPETMAIGAAGLGCIAVASGLGGSVVFDVPSGPAIVLAAVAVFALTRLFDAQRRLRRD